jgi:16S rRNA C1402 (ribose-2'-O) methylase RsmI
MIENQNSKEKLLSMLTDIYEQLEELEVVLEHSLTDLRENLNNQQLNPMNELDNKISDTESAYQDLLMMKQYSKENTPNPKKALKLELGF